MDKYKNNINKYSNNIKKIKRHYQMLNYFVEKLNNPAICMIIVGDFLMKVIEYQTIYCSGFHYVKKF